MSPQKYTRRGDQRPKNADTTTGRHATAADRPSQTSSALQLTATVLAWLAVAAVVFVLTYRPVSDPDTWFHLKLGQWIQQNGQVPRTDPFSHTAGDTPYVPSGWLTAVFMHQLDQVYPDSSVGPILMVTAIIGIASLVILARAWRAGTIVATSLLLMSGLCMAVVRFSPRPDIWSILGITLLFWLLTADWFRPIRRSRRGRPAGEYPSPDPWLMWVLPFLIIAWANLHAGVIIAIPFLLTYAVWLLYRWYKTGNDAWANAALPVAIACVAWQANPYGPGLANLAWRISQIPQVSWVMEWMPFFKADFPLAWPAYLAGAFLLCVIIWVIAGSWRNFHPLEILWLIMLVAFTLMQRRQVGLLAVGAPLILARHLVPMELWLRHGVALRGIAAAGALAVAVAAFQVTGANGTGGGRPYHGRNCSVLPCVTAEFLAQNPPPQPIFNSYNLGGYLLHELHPNIKVFIDGRLDVYPHQVWQDMLAVEENRLSVDELVSRYGIQTFVIGIADSFGDSMHLASRLAARPDFALVHFDDVAAVFVRATAANIDYLNKHAYPSLFPWDLQNMARTVANPEAQQQIINDVGRLLLQSGQAASASALAAYIAWIAGDTETMNEQLTWARQRQPNNRLLRLVEERIQSAEEAVVTNSETTQ